MKVLPAIHRDPVLGWGWYQFPELVEVCNNLFLRNGGESPIPAEQMIHLLITLADYEERRNRSPLEMGRYFILDLKQAGTRPGHQRRFNELFVAAGAGLLLITAFELGAVEIKECGVVVLIFKKDGKRIRIEDVVKNKGRIKSPVPA